MKRTLSFQGLVFKMKHNAVLIFWTRYTPIVFIPLVILFLLLHLGVPAFKMSLTALSDGASLVYTSVKEMKNLDILYKYLVHRLYGFPFHCPAQVVERDAVFM